MYACIGLFQYFTPRGRGGGICPVGLEGIIEACPGGMWNKIEACPGGHFIYKSVPSVCVEIQ